MCIKKKECAENKKETDQKPVCPVCTDKNDATPK